MADSFAFDPPGPGEWVLDRSHYPGGTTPLAQELMRDATSNAFVKLFALRGLPAQTMSMEFVNGFAYTRLVPLVGASSNSSKPPPRLALWLVSRLHPEFRRRAHQADETIHNPPWASEIARWHSHIKPDLTARTKVFQDEDVVSLDDEALAAQLRRLVAFVAETAEEHFRLHGSDLGPLGLLISAADSWGIPATDVLPALQGASPSTTAPRRALADLRTELESVGINLSDPSALGTLDDVRQASARSATLLDAYLDEHGEVLYNGYDLTSNRLCEAPDLILTSIRHATDPGDDTKAVEAELAEQVTAIRARVPATEQDRFDKLLSEARSAMDLRDENGPITIERPFGLLRRYMLELGGRLHDRGRLDKPDHVFEFNTAELIAVAEGASSPTADEAAQRAELRLRQAALDPPATLGPPAPEPDLSALPRSMYEVVLLVNAVLEQLGLASTSTVHNPSEPGDVITGAGIGSTVITAPARVVTDADQALSELQQGEILVTRMTSPAFNLALTHVGGLVTADGGPMSHAAVLARELGFPAVIGVGSLDPFTTGQTLTVDPEAGSVTIAD